LHDDVVALLEAIEIILVDGDMFNWSSISPGGDDQAAAARERARGHFTDNRGGNANGV
jgi:hypothetical protein